MNNNNLNKSYSIVSLLAFIGLLFYSTNLMADDQVSISANEQLTQIIDERWDFSLKENPLSATRAGVNKYNHLLNRVSSKDNDRRLAAERVFLTRLIDIDIKTLSAENRINHQLLQWVIKGAIDGYQLNLSRIPLNTFSSFYLSVLNMSNGLVMNNIEDYQDYISRLNDIPRYFNENIINMRTGIETDFTLPKIVVEGILPTVQAQIYQDPTKSSLYKPFLNINNTISLANQTLLRAHAKQAISKSAIPAFTTFTEFFGGEYLQAASKNIGAAQMNNGKAYYAHQIKTYTFHDALLGNGALPLTMVEAEIDRFIAASN